MYNELSFVQLSSSINPSFWNKFTEVKLDKDKLHEVEHHIWGYFNIITSKGCNKSLLEVDSTSFNEKFNSLNAYIPFHGVLINKNTVEQFRECNKTDLINEVGKGLLERIKNGCVLQDPSILNHFLVLSFADLKKYHYYYWFAFPVPRGLVVDKSASCLIGDEFTEKEIDILCMEFRKCDQKTHFLVERMQDNVKLHFLQNNLQNINTANKNQYYFAFYNISAINTEVGPQLKNYIVLILQYCPFLQGHLMNFLAFNLSRKDDFSITCDKSIIYKLKLPFLEENFTWVGWEKNERDKMGPRLANMKNTLDPQVIAENSVDLNLKLMKWRIMPDINIEKVKNTKCLILGSGTLGCSVARTLLAWGVRTITFIDNSTVSFSNPVRQSLFTYQDSVQTKSKALAAADNLRTIFPGVDSRGFNLTIPMPGHPVGESLLAQTKEDIAKLTELIKGHDVIFLLMDSRESRWLPTLLTKCNNKITINAALGFDTYMIMRHGIGNESNATPKTNHCPEGFKCINGTDLGCYFCNDITAPGDSVKDKTLDQQCTVTRPGVSQVAGALAVELMVSMLQNEDGARAPAFYKSVLNSSVDIMDLDEQSLLGLLPHSIRGFLSSFQNILPATPKYNNCIACSDIVMKEYRENGMDFLLKVVNSSKYLEDVVKLPELFEGLNFEDILPPSDEDEDDGDS